MSDRKKKAIPIQNEQTVNGAAKPNTGRYGQTEKATAMEVDIEKTCLRSNCRVSAGMFMLVGVYVQPERRWCYL